MHRRQHKQKLAALALRTSQHVVQIASQRVLSKILNQHLNFHKLVEVTVWRIATVKVHPVRAGGCLDLRSVPDNCAPATSIARGRLLFASRLRGNVHNSCTLNLKAWRQNAISYANSTAPNMTASFALSNFRRSSGPHGNIASDIPKQSTTQNVYSG